MKSRRTRRVIRDLVRRAKERDRGTTAAAQPEVAGEAPCACGHLLKATSNQQGRVYACPSCERNYSPMFDQDETTGRWNFLPLYIDDSTIGNTTAIATIPRGSAPPEQPAETAAETLGPEAEEAGELDAMIEPDPPGEIPFACPCGREGTALRIHYDRHLDCHGCGQRLLMTLVYRPDEQRFSIAPVRVSR